MKRVFRNWWVVSIVIALIVLALLVWALPIFVAFLRPFWVRATAAALVLGVWALLAFLRARRARKAAAAIAKELAGPSAADEEGRLLAGRMQEALASLKTASGRKRDYLYARPWYVIIGPPGAGKTTALVNSGLRFPYSQQALKGVGGTRNLDFWFADEAVLIDTAGRYTTQDSNFEVDARGWTSFLSLLKKHRPLQPVNGIIIAIAVDELIRADCRGIDDHAAAVRRRLAELRSTIEVEAPIYVMLTKADLLAGFIEYFDDLDVEGRRAVLGRTLPFSPGKPQPDALAAAFDELAQALADRQAKRLFEEVDQARRALLLGFPAQLQSLRARFHRFMEGVFAGGEAPGGVLRGFYLTSGVQEGAPLDRILSSVAQVYDQPGQARPGGSGRAYFLNRLLTEVMFKEAGLVQMDPKARARLKTRLTAAFAAIGLAAILLTAAWSVSFARNRSFQSEILAAAAQARDTARANTIDLRQVRGTDADLRLALPLLDALRALPRGYEERRAGWAPLMMRFGLYQSSLSRQAEETYLEALRRIMLPRLLLRLEAYMQAHRNDAMALYEPLKVYLMLGGHGPGIDRATVQNWVTRDWAAEVYRGSDSAHERGRLARHLTALLEDPNIASVWPGRQAPLDGALVAEARALITSLSLADRAYAVMRQNALAAGSPWRMAGQISAGDARAFANPDEVLAVEVPYFFTRQGYERVYLIRLATVQNDIRRDLWVLGDNAGTAGLRTELGDLRAGIAARYASDYSAAWNRVVEVLRPADYFRDLAAYSAFTKSSPPLKTVLLEVRRNTTFEGGTRAALGRQVQQRLTRSRAGQFASDMSQGRVGAMDAGAQIATAFAELHDYVGDGRGTAPVDRFVDAVRTAGQAVIAARSNPGAGGTDAIQAAMVTAVASVQAAAQGAPSQLSNFVAAAARSGSAAQTSAASGAIAEAYAQSVRPRCTEAAQERYPFFGRSPRDAAAADMLAVFGQNGVIQAFVEQRLRPLMDTSGPVWRWRSDAPVTSSLDPTSAEEFARAGRIRDLLANGLPLRVRAERLGSAVEQVVVYGGLNSQQFDRTATGPKPLAWQMSGAPEAYVVLRPPAAGGGTEVRFEAEGPWALFRLMDQADRENVDARTIRATFGQGAQAASLLITLPGEDDPFSRGGFWRFRCPLSL